MFRRYWAYTVNYCGRAFDEDGSSTVVTVSRQYVISSDEGWFPRFPLFAAYSQIGAREDKEIGPYHIVAKKTKQRFDSYRETIVSTMRISKLDYNRMR
jgi:hypothetical protein